MTSFKQIEANRRNAFKSSGPTSTDGKQASRRNALRHGFTAETVLEPLENAEEYRAFEAAIIAEYLPQTPVERELVHRLASLFWRLRRATSIETGLLRMQGEILLAFRSARQRNVATDGGVRCASTVANRDRRQDLLDDRNGADVQPPGNEEGTASPSRDIALSYLRLANLDNDLIDRLSRYEAILWRQVVQTLFTLQTLKRR